MYKEFLKEGGTLGEGSGEEAKGLWVGGVSVRAWRYRCAVDFVVDTQVCSLCEDVARIKIKKNFSIFGGKTLIFNKPDVLDALGE